jgi:hypothetical protein
MISPIAYFSYFPVFPLESKFCLIFLNNFIIGYGLVIMKATVLCMVSGVFQLPNLVNKNRIENRRGFS